MALTKVTQHSLGNSAVTTAKINLTAPLGFANSTANVVYMTANGNVGIGTTTPNWMLHIKGTFPYIAFEDTDGTSNTVSTVTGYQSGAMYYDSDTNNIQPTSTTGHHFRTNGGTTIASIKGNGVVDLLYGQLKFPGSQNASTDANTLDDYEEGTWTPIDVSGAGLTFSGTFGSYVKIGKLVWVNFNLTYPSTGNTSTAQVGGLPFNIESIGGDNGTMAGGLGYVSSGVVMQIHHLVGSSSWRWYNIATAQQNNNVSGITYRGGFVYRASA